MVFGERGRPRGKHGGTEKVQRFVPAPPAGREGRVYLDTVLATRRSSFAGAGISLAPRGASGEGWERGRLARCEQDRWEKDPAVNRCRFKITSSPRPSPLLFVEERENISALGSFGQGQCQDAPRGRGQPRPVPGALPNFANSGLRTACGLALKRVRNVRSSLQLVVTALIAHEFPFGRLAQTFWPFHLLCTMDVALLAKLVKSPPSPPAYLTGLDLIECDQRN